MTFIASKILGSLLQPSNLVLLILVIGAGMSWTRWRRAGRVLASIATFVLVVATVFPLGSSLLAVLESRFPPLQSLPAEVDGIVMIGGVTSPALTQRWGQPSLNEGAERITAFIALARYYPAAKLVFTGGSGSLKRGDWREADDVKLLLEQLGFDVGRVQFERESRNTIENARLALELARPNAGERWLLITSAFHVPRAVGCFRTAGWTDIVAYPVDFRTQGSISLWPGLSSTLGTRLLSLDEAIHEWAGLIAYRLMKRTGSLFPAP
ncbi:MAG: YdcF family protein [Alphaproteobacteria bacterium]|nr:YdcF family protein [Alphaproteobacteria bacterium]